MNLLNKCLPPATSIPKTFNFFGTVAILLIWAQGVISASPLIQISESEFQLRMRDGSLVRVSCDDETVMWKSVSDTGEITESQIRLNDIKSVTFAPDSAGEQVAAIRKLIEALNDNDYQVRNKAEMKLGTEGLPFLSIIEQFRGHSEPEAKYRLARVIDRLKNQHDESVIPSNLQFDILETTGGRRMYGDIGEWVLAGRWNDLTITADRKNCTGISISSDGISNPPPQTSGVSITGRSITSTSQFLDNNKPRPGMTFVDFETGNGNVSLQSGIKDPVEHLFSFAGCLFHCDTNNGDVIISTYKFKKGISLKNSLCNLHFDPVTDKTIRFKGVMRIEFCVPGQPGFPAGVYSMGTGTEIVVPKQTLVEAWNSAGHVTGMTYAADDKNSFLGVESNDPMVALTFGVNRYLNLEKVNEDYAIDDLCFSEPIPVLDLNRVDDNSTSVIITREGDRLMVESILFRADRSQIEFILAMNKQPVSLPLARVAWIVGPQNGLPKSRQFEGISIMTRDSSVIHTSSTGLASIDNPELVIPASEVIGVWNPSTPARYPRSGDFKKGNVVVVRPLQRIASTATIDWKMGTIDFDMESATTFRQPLLAGADSDDAAKTEVADFEIAPVAGSTFNIAELTNIWTASPATRDDGTGLLRTHDGQQFVLGGASGFSLTGVDGTTVMIARDGQSLSFVLNQIYALEFPDE